MSGRHEYDDCAHCHQTVRVYHDGSQPYVELVDFGGRMAKSDDPMDAPDSLGFHRIGKGCARKLRKLGYRVLIGREVDE